MSGLDSAGTAGGANVASEAAGPAVHPPRRLGPGALLPLLLVLVLAGGSYWAAPWVLPPRIDEGPLIQQPTATGATLIWFTTRPTTCAFALSIDGQERAVPVESDGRRHRVHVTGLEPGRRVPYRIQAGGRLQVEAAFRTGKAYEQPFSFLVFGDSGRGSRAQFQLARRMELVAPPPDFLLHTGDLIYPDGARRRYRARFFAPYRELLQELSFWPCVGNHDVNDDGGAAYRAVFELPGNGPPGRPTGHDYWFDYAAARFVVLDSNVDEAALQTQTVPWLRETLEPAPAQSAPRWKFAIFHHPPFTDGSYRPDARLQRTLVPVLEEAGVDLVFCGHDHMYQRSRPLRGGAAVPADEGVIYIISGAGGARLYAAQPPDRRSTAAVLDNSMHSFTQVQIAGDLLTLEQIALDGRRIDKLILRKDAAGRRSVELEESNPREGRQVNATDPRRRRSSRIPLVTP